LSRRSRATRNKLLAALLGLVALVFFVLGWFVAVH